jgi:hypothetical protein
LGQGVFTVFNRGRAGDFVHQIIVHVFIMRVAGLAVFVVVSAVAIGSVKVVHVLIVDLVIGIVIEPLAVGKGTTAILVVGDSGACSLLLMGLLFSVPESLGLMGRSWAVPIRGGVRGLSRVVFGGGRIVVLKVERV